MTLIVKIIVTLFIFSENFSSIKKLTQKEAAQNLKKTSDRKLKVHHPKQPSCVVSMPNRSTPKENTTEFVIPELPEGRLLEMKIYSNWGDKYVVGLNGIELFDCIGRVVKVEKVRFLKFYEHLFKTVQYIQA